MGVQKIFLQIVLVTTILSMSVPMTFFPYEESIIVTMKHDNEISEYSSIERDIEFTLGKSFDVSNTITHADIGERSATNIVNEIDEFVHEDLVRVNKTNLYYTEVSLNITQIHVIEDREFIGPGSIFLNVLLNDDSPSHEFTFDNDGDYYVANDDEYVDVSILLTDSLYSIDGWFCLEIHGWEADPVIGFPDDYMGGEIWWANVSDLISETYSGWWSLNDFDSIGGNNDIQLEVYVEIEFGPVERLTYPDDLEVPFSGSTFISAIYFPKIWYDTLDFAHIPIIECVYEQVYWGYDPAIDDYSYLIYYMFYWDHELDSLSFGHYYDFEPLLMFVRELGLEPYRLVYRDIGQHTLPPKVIIQDYYAATGTDNITVNVATKLTPILGYNCTVEYEIRNDYFSTEVYHYKTDHGLMPYMTVPHIAITNSYHQMEVGVPPGCGEAVLDPIEDYLYPFIDNVIRSSYSLLDETFESDINVYEGVWLWNGGDYKVPYNMSLTIDMLHNHYEFPYIVDCWEEVVHYTEGAQKYKKNGFYYDFGLDLQFTVPATVTLNVPTTVRKGQTYDIDIGLELNSDEIGITFLYDIMLGYVLHWWFIGVEQNITYAGRYEFAVSLDDISEFITGLGLSCESFTGDYCGGWLTVTDLSTSTDLLGTMLDAQVEVHMLKIVEDLLGSTSVSPIIKLLGFFLDEVDLIISPMICGNMTAEIELNNEAISLDKEKLTFAEGVTQDTIQMTVPGGHDTTSVSLTNMKYNVMFSTDWSLELNFTNVLNYFVDDYIFPLGTFPEITVSSEDHTIAADDTTGYDTEIEMTVINDITPPSVDTTINPTSPTSSDTVVVSATITDESTITDAILSYSINDGSTWTNTTMTFNSGTSKYEASIPSQTSGTDVMYKIYAGDFYDNWAITDTSSYSVYDPPPTSSTTAETTSPTTGTPPFTPVTGDTMAIIIIVGGIAAAICVIIIAAFVIKKR
jgi:hypothetical protein